LRGVAALEEPKEPKERVEPEDEEPEDEEPEDEDDPVTSDAVGLADLVFDADVLVVVGAFFVTLEATGVDLGADAMALRCATVTVPPVGVLVVFGFEAVPVVGRYRPPPTYIVAISMLLDRDGQCTDGPRR
jgi:hypothetical protein